MSWDFGPILDFSLSPQLRFSLRLVDLSQVVAVILGGWRGVGWVCGRQVMVNFVEVCGGGRRGGNGF